MADPSAKVTWSTLCPSITINPFLSCAPYIVTVEQLRAGQIRDYFVEDCRKRCVKRARHQLWSCNHEIWRLPSHWTRLALRRLLSDDFSVMGLAVMKLYEIGFHATWDEMLMFVQGESLLNNVWILGKSWLWNCDVPGSLLRYALIHWFPTWGVLTPTRGRQSSAGGCKAFLIFGCQSFIYKIYMSQHLIHFCKENNNI